LQEYIQESLSEILEILYQDEFLVIINKPSGLLVHKSDIDKRETKFALQMLRKQIKRYVYPIHRLDKATSGVLVFALNKEIAQKLSYEFKTKNIQKTYIALVRGYTDEKKLIDHPLTQMLDTKEQKQKGISKEAQEAKTYYERVATIELPYANGKYATSRYSLVKLEPQTGRKHQLRRHMKHDMHHIIGDTKHGKGEHNRLFREKYDVHRLLLHALSISFAHPMTNEPLYVKASFDETFQKLFKEFGWRI
jgi:tRNA pseudouridine65 synthase